MPAQNPVDELQKAFDKIKTQEDLAEAIGEKVVDGLFKAGSSPFKQMQKDAQDRLSKNAAGISFSEDDPDVQRVEGDTGDPIKRKLDELLRKIERMPQDVRNELESG